MDTPAYPATRLRVGLRDPRFGGQPADDFGGPAWAFHDNAIQELERQQLQALWSAASVTRARVASAGLAGDFLLFLSENSNGAYVLKTVAAFVADGGTYDGLVTPRFGMLAESCSAYTGPGDEPLVVLAGIVPASVHGLNPGVACSVAMNTTTGRLVVATGDPAEVVVGRLSVGGTLFLAAWNPSSP